MSKTVLVSGPVATQTTVAKGIGFHSRHVGTNKHTDSPSMDPLYLHHHTSLLSSNGAGVAKKLGGALGPIMHTIGGYIAAHVSPASSSTYGNSSSSSGGEGLYESMKRYKDQNGASFTPTYNYYYH
jgi:hypothetical protein